ncbi:MAG: hypothetical protein ACLU6O_04315 [Bilophila wadsworthia]
MLLEATDLGLGSCWLMHFDPAPIREQFRIPGQSLNTSSPSVTRRKIRTSERHPSASRWRLLLLRNLSRKRLRGEAFLEKGLLSKLPLSPKTCLGNDKRKHIISFRRHPFLFCTTKDRKPVFFIQEMR